MALGYRLPDLTTIASTFTATEALAGKSLGTDLSTGKLTLPILVVLEKGTSSDREMLQSCNRKSRSRKFRKNF